MREGVGRLLAGADIHLSSSSCFRTSPMIWPTLCNALMFSSVLLNSFSKSLISRRRFFSLTSQFRDSSSESVYLLMASALSGSDMLGRSAREGAG